MKELSEKDRGVWRNILHRLLARSGQVAVVLGYDLNRFQDMSAEYFITADEAAKTTTDYAPNVALVDSEISLAKKALFVVSFNSAAVWDSLTKKVFGEPEPPPETERESIVNQEPSKP